MNIDKYKSLPIAYTVNGEITADDTRFINITIDVLHTGKNYNGSVFTKEVVDESINSIKNTPILGYIPLTDDGSIGDFDQHNYKHVKRDGENYYVYAGSAYGVIPESCNPRWVEKVSSDGHLREYLQVDALLWTKFKDAADIFKRDKIKNQSMELQESSMQGYEIEDNSFIFTGFKFDGCCILSTSDPCIQPAMIDSVAVAHFNTNSVALEIKQKLNEYARVLQQPTSDLEVDPNIQTLKEGGTNHLNRDELLEKYSIKEEDLAFSIDAMPEDELEQKLIELSEVKVKDYMLNSLFMEGLCAEVYAEKIETEYGLSPRYSLMDYDMAAFEVYCYDRTDWLLYGFPFSIDGDSVKVDFECKKRKKSAIVDYVEGEDQDKKLEVYSKQALDAALAYTSLEIAQVNQALEEANSLIAAAETTIAELSEFKSTALKVEREEAEAELFGKFRKDLEGNVEFEELKAHAAGYSIDALQEKCFSIWGKAKANFSIKGTRATSVKLPVEHHDPTEEPYGGLFNKYQINES